MDVSDAVRQRASIRAFTDQPVDDDQLRSLLETAARAPSGGNVQPWRIYVVNGDAMTRFRESLVDRPLEAAEYDIYPPSLWEPYRTNRFALGEAMYATIGIERDDKAGRLAQFARNDEFFGAPAGLFCFIDRGMGPPQWSDLGMFLQTFMLLAVEAGLDTCPQEYWTVRHGAVQEFVGAPENEMLFCGMAIGYADRAAPINTLESERMPLDEWARFV
ncbi:nitroreductase [Ilumatobacter fluminis]|uniref:Nitroreductase n=1 Tax=Ilumatobacter fluminis TaxID=467091 RepID=A0A4R7I255_9ACTN|nr:nitroreductase [Ilumatobacter fluminis]TDT17672.1 nitroreductase [Ilumatobacter fluminis]